MKGTKPEFADQYILIDAHFDGPINGGPAMELANQPTMNNPYDDGGAAAALLLLAEKFQKQPPQMSIICFLSDAEEGCKQLKGELPEVCTRCPVKMEDGRCDENFGEAGHLMGWGALADDPILPKVRLVLAADPWGKPGVKGSDYVIIMGADATPNLRTTLLKYWPLGSAFTKPLFASRKVATENAWNGDWVTKYRPADANSSTLDASEWISELPWWRERRRIDATVPHHA